MRDSLALWSNARVVDRIPELLAELGRSDGWVTAGALADRLGVSTRTVRSWVTAVRTASAPVEVIASSPEGYRLNRDGAEAFRSRPRGAPTTPQGRLSFLVSALSRSDEGTDVHSAADLLHVSTSTLEADLARLRLLASGSGLTVERTGSRVRLVGSDAAQRQLISRLFRQEQLAGPIDLAAIERAFPVGDLRAFKSDLVELLEEQGFEINELGLDGVIVHAAIAADRSAHRGAGTRRPSIRPSGPTQEAEAEAEADDDDPLATPFAALVERHFGVEPTPAETEALVQLLRLRAGNVRRAPEPATLSALRRIVRRAEAEFLVHLDEDAFIERLALHVQNLIARSRDGAAAPNPLTRTIKSSYPLTYELAVFLTAELQREFDISTSDDEIAYIALHVGTRLVGAERPTASVTLVAPRYHDLAADLARRIDAHLAGVGRVDLIVERSDQPLHELPGDVIVTAVPGAVSAGRVVAVGPLPASGDLDAIRAGVDRALLARRRRAIAEDLGAYFDAELFVRGAPARDEEELIRLLGSRMRDRGLVDDAWIEGAIERERLSSTAFTDSLAVPHSLELSAARTAIAVMLLDSPMLWGDGTVQIVALVAFSPDDRASFQTVFDQFVEAFSDRGAVARLLADAHDAASFVDAVAGLIDD